MSAETSSRGEEIIIDPNKDWQTYRNCDDADPGLFFPERGASVKAAKAICQECVVREECLEYAIVNNEKFGIWGGLSERQRRSLVKAYRLRQG